MNVPLVLLSRRPRAAYPRGWFRVSAGYALVIVVAVVAGRIAGPQRLVELVDPTGKFVATDAGRLFGSKSAAAAALRWKETLAKEGREVSLATDNWGWAGVLSFYTPGHPYYFVYPYPTRHGRDYILWNTKSPPAPATVFVSYKPRLSKEIPAACADMKLLSKKDGPPEPFMIYLCTGLNPPRTPNSPHPGNQE